MGTPLANDGALMQAQLVQFHRRPVPVTGPCEGWGGGFGVQRKAARRAGRIPEGSPLANDGAFMQVPNRSFVAVKGSYQDQAPCRFSMKLPCESKGLPRSKGRFPIKLPCEAKGLSRSKGRSYAF